MKKILWFGGNMSCPGYDVLRVHNPAKELEQQFFYKISMRNILQIQCKSTIHTEIEIANIKKKILKQAGKASFKIR